MLFEIWNPLLYTIILFMTLSACVFLYFVYTGKELTDRELYKAKIGVAISFFVTFGGILCYQQYNRIQAEHDFIASAQRAWESYEDISDANFMHFVVHVTPTIDGKIVEVWNYPRKRCEKEAPDYVIYAYPDGTYYNKFMDRID